MTSPISDDTDTAAGPSTAALHVNAGIIQQHDSLQMAVEVGHSSLAGLLASHRLQPIRILNDKEEIEVMYRLQHGDSFILGNEQAMSAMAIRMALLPHEHVLAEPIVDHGPASQATFMASTLPQHDRGLFQPAPVQGSTSQPPLMDAHSSSDLPQHGNGHVEQAATDQEAQPGLESAERAEKRRKRRARLMNLGRGAAGITFIVMNVLHGVGVF
ncbi:Leptomycin B resistance protein pmd1 [Venturia nashicola]|nr:Leptomycin B resistance protein pmd1 [Venturia nashicola]